MIIPPLFPYVLLLGAVVCGNRKRKLVVSDSSLTPKKSKKDKNK